MRMDPDGSNIETVARGIRNTVGFDWHPSTGELWFTDNGRDRMGDDLPVRKQPMSFPALLLYASAKRHQQSPPPHVPSD